MNVIRKLKNYPLYLKMHLSYLAAKRAYLKQKNSFQPQNNDFECIIFSKDRPIQLYALLESYFHYVANYPPPRILYASSHGKFEPAYREVFSAFEGKLGDVVRERDSFKSGLETMLNELTGDRLFFLVDDIVFTRHFDLFETLDFSPLETVFSFRHGGHLTRCYTQDKEQPLPEDLSEILDGRYLRWTWSKGVLNWGYPLSTDGHVFSTKEISFLISRLHYEAPNTLEELLQAFNPFFKLRHGICYPESVLFNIPCNKVQVENENLFGDIHQDFLLEKWNEGLKIDISRFDSFVNESAHKEVELDYIERV